MIPTSSSPRDAVLGNGRTLKVLGSVAEQSGKVLMFIVTLGDELREERKGIGQAGVGFPRSSGKTERADPE